ncbi:carbohydrate porin [Vibrio aestuarianus]|uniref:Carbohydrate porin n=1 Tax=Vibrio aestuarianus TaxID=28171 RepID=A0A9X4FLE7_9VIBR|nr:MULTISPECIES: carbohydrate porin [Vibrio]MDE1250744.1 carbohydrate porin [Vibrio aestuarianus]MDE1312244.1 carbohydrate porin [Vibrio aestuarianus]MDE1357550.1 carbohydrate porin [Vibrio aestuarianus]MDF9398884.1 maltoporin [Vibrio sp. 1180_3]NGZ92647.1 maltoporin [Vibrio aestuarianus subsp. cardii]
MKKVSVIAAAVASALFAGSVFAETEVALDAVSGDSAAPKVEKVNGTDVLKDGWEVHGYASMNFRMVDGETVDTEFGKPDYKTAGTHGKSTNQVEFVIKKHTEHANGVWSDFVVRTEYGNGNSYAYSSPGSQKANDTAQFEVKETFVEIGGLSYLGEDTSIWGGQRYLNRAAGLLSGEFWKQSSGVGAGIQTKLAGNTAGFAVVTADTDGDINNGPGADGRETLISYDLYYYGVDVGFGSLDFDFKYMEQANKDSNADDGFGAAITLNTSYYGLDGWTQNAIAYGKGVAQNRGVNFGSWSGGDDNAESIFLTSYGVLNISENWQMGSEITYFAALDELFGADDLKRFIVAVRPSYKVNDNLRIEMTGSYAHEEGAEGYWGRTGDDVESDIFNVELAAAFTVNADYFGRPQIKPYISYISADDEASASQIGIKDGKNETVIGVHTEIWF